MTLRAISTSPLRHTTRITFIRDYEPRRNRNNQVTENFGGVRTWAYSFEINSPDIWHEEVGAVIRAKLLANGGHYSPKNARYDWLTINHFADMSDGASNNFGVTVSNADAYFMKIGRRVRKQRSTRTRRRSMFWQADKLTVHRSWNSESGRRFKFLMQRFALQTHSAFNQTDAMKFSLEHQNPLVAGMIEGIGTQNRPIIRRTVFRL